MENEAQMFLLMQKYVTVLVCAEIIIVIAVSGFWGLRTVVRIMTSDWGA